MANMEGKFVRGIVGKQVYRVYRGKQVVQSLPNTNPKKRTEGTKKAASLFGKSSAFASYIRDKMYAATGDFHDGTMVARFNAEILYCLKNSKHVDMQTFDFKANSFATLAGFEFNVGSTLKNHLLIQPEISLEGTTLTVHIPELKIPTDIKFPEINREACKLLMVTVMVDLTHSKIIAIAPQVMDVPYSFHPKVIAAQTFTTAVEPGCLCITAISLQFTKKTVLGSLLVNSKAFNPAGIVHAAIAEGEVNALTTAKWKDIKVDLRTL